MSLSLAHLIAVNLGPRQTASCLARQGRREAREAKTDWAPRRLTMDERGECHVSGPFSCLLAGRPCLGNALLRGCGSAESGMPGVVFCLLSQHFALQAAVLFSLVLSVRVVWGRGGPWRKQREIERGCWQNKADDVSVGLETWRFPDSTGTVWMGGVETRLEQTKGGRRKKLWFWYFVMYHREG